MIENRPEPSYTVIPRFYSLKSTRRGDTAHTDRDTTQEKREREGRVGTGSWALGKLWIDRMSKGLT